MVPFQGYEKMLEDERRAVIELQQERINDLETQLTEMRNSTSPFEERVRFSWAVREMGLELGKLVDEKQLAYGDQ